MTTQSLGSTSTMERTEIDPLTGEPRCSHIVAPKGSGADFKSGAVLAMEARLEGTPVTALCGHSFVPSRDPRSLPECQACNEILKINTGAGDSSKVPNA